MKYFMLFFILFLSCNTIPNEIVGECQDKDRIITMNSLKSELEILNFRIYKFDTINKFISAWTVPHYNGYSGFETNMWIIYFNKNQVTAEATHRVYGTDKFYYSDGANVTLYYDDNCAKSWGWYWRIRNLLNELCNSNLIIRKK